MSDKKIIVLGCATLLIFWLVETLIHVSIIREGSFFDQLVRPETHELWMRTIIMVIIVMLFFYIHSFYRLRESKRLLSDAVAAVEEEKAKKEAIIAGIGDGIVVQDRDYKIIYQNEIHTEIYGSHNGEYCYKIHEGRDTLCEGCPVEMSFRDGKVHKKEKSIETDDGTMHVELTSSPLRDSDGKVVAGILVLRDISVRKQYEEEIVKYQTQLEELVQERTFELQASNQLLLDEINERRQTQEKYRALFANMLNGFAYHKVVVDEANNPIDYIFLEVNAAFERLTGFKREDIIGRKVTEVIPGLESARPDLIRTYGMVALTGENKSFAIYVEPLKKSFSISAYCPEPGYFVAIFDDITEERTLEKNLIEVEERERRRIGHDLHDGLGQLLTGLAFKIRGLGRVLEASDIPQADDVAAMSILIDEAKEQVSSLSKNLSPVAMDEEGLMSAFKSLSYYTKKMFGIPCTFRYKGTVAVHDATVITQLYRITQEAVTNAVKHAEPHRIEIGLCRDDGKIIVTIKDDGTGITEEINKTGMGLKIMRYRASLIRASLDIKRGSNGGTEVSCIVPERA